MTADSMTEAVEAAARALIETDGFTANAEPSNGLFTVHEDDIEYVARAALEAALPILRAQFAEEVAVILMDQKIICPVHKMPDCSPLLNACSLPNLLYTQVHVDAATVRNWGRAA